MVQFFTISLCVSIVGITVLFVLKQIELSTGTVIFAGARPKVNRFFKTCLVLIERVLPGLVKDGAFGMLRRARIAAQVVVAHAILKVETTLKNILRTIREKTHPSYTRGEASAFLKEVGEYKKQIETESQEDRSLY